MTIDLSSFTGSEVWFRHSLNRNYTYTEGVQYFAEQAGAYWLLDILVTEPKILQLARTIAFITLSVKDGKAKLIASDGGVMDQPEKIVYKRNISFTDCPEGDWKFYMTDNVILLPSEY